MRVVFVVFVVCGVEIRRFFLGGGGVATGLRFWGLRFWHGIQGFFEGGGGLRWGSGLCGVRMGWGGVGDST